MDDVSGNENITQLFAHQNDVLFNFVCSKIDKMSNLLNMNQADIESICLQFINTYLNLDVEVTVCQSLKYINI